jgi:hypothetical protein
MSNQTGAERMNNTNEIRLAEIIEQCLTYDDAKQLRRAIELSGVTEQQLGKVLCVALQNINPKIDAQIDAQTVNAEFTS